MIATDFPQAHKTLSPPAGMDNCGGLRVWTDGTQTISCWRPTAHELVKLAAGEPVYLFVVYAGGTQPPVALEVGSPFPSQSISEADAAVLRELGISGANE